MEKTEEIKEVFNEVMVVLGIVQAGNGSEALGLTSMPHLNLELATPKHCQSSYVLPILTPYFPQLILTHETASDCPKEKAQTVSKD